MKTIAISTNKGGVGKTALSHTMCLGLALTGKTVLLVDNDPQGTLSGTYCDIDQTLPGMAQIYKGENEIFDCLIQQEAIQIDDEPTLIVVSANKELQGIFDPLTKDMFKLDRLTEALKEPAIQQAFDYCIIDNNPMFYGPNEASIRAADQIIIPCIPTKSDIQGLHRTFDNIRLMGPEQFRKISHIIPSKVVKTKLMRDNLEIMYRLYGKLVTMNKVMESSILPKMVEQKKILYISEGAHDFSQSMLALIAEVFSEIKIEQIIENLESVKKKQKISNLLDWMKRKKLKPLSIIKDFTERTSKEVVL